MLVLGTLCTVPRNARQWAMTDEQWLPIPGFEGRYDVSDMGRVRSWQPRWKVLPRPIGGQPNSHGYPVVKLKLGDGRRVPREVHKLVLLAFVGPRPDGLEGRHIDGDPLNNARGNLAYGTHAENEMDKVRHGTHRNSSKTHCPQGHRYDAENTRRNRKGQRVCRACHREREAARKARAAH